MVLSAGTIFIYHLIGLAKILLCFSKIHTLSRGALSDWAEIAAAEFVAVDSLIHELMYLPIRVLFIVIWFRLWSMQYLIFNQGELFYTATYPKTPFIILGFWDIIDLKCTDFTSKYFLNLAVSLCLRWSVLSACIYSFDFILILYEMAAQFV